jgi:hypothetical protein
LNITQLTELVADSLPAHCRNDLPAIRQALNDAVDQAVRSGDMTERAANDWDQAYAVRRVQSLLRVKLLAREGVL